ncbi:unnamed protein product [Rotaria sordida]|uniref:Prohibitin n=1 Tax=Rotaria sordida TaxID=392033 RepID=A0A815YJE5_9BILA|nr:unnamed protein product [Rotaria sordida]CAF1571496.1 unnamed protein product [Rotaria sordida]
MTELRDNYEKAQQKLETADANLKSQLYGLEKFWAFLKYSRQKPKITRKLEEILKNYKNLEDFRVGGASFSPSFFPTKSNYKEFSVLGRIEIGLGIGGGVINSILYNVDDGHRDVIFDRFQGVKLDVIEEGTHFMISWLHRPIIFDIHLQTINITLRILYRPRAELLPKLFCKFGFKICCTKSQFDAIQLTTQRALISQRVSELLTERTAQFGLIELRRIEAAESIANQLSKSRNSVYLPHGPQMLLNITGAMQEKYCFLFS